MYDELWTAGKAMYKLEPAVAMGGEVIIYAPHLDVVSHVHGQYIYEIGYHILPYFLNDWERSSTSRWACWPTAPTCAGLA